MKYILAFLFTLVAFSHVVYAKDIVNEANVVLFKLTTKDAATVTGTSANILAEVVTVAPNTKTVTSAGFFYNKKDSINPIEVSSSIALLPQNRTFGSILNTLTCNTEYEFLPFIRYEGSTGRESGDRKTFKTASCPTNTLSITTLSTTGFASTSVSVQFEASNRTTYRSVSTLEIRESNLATTTFARVAIQTSAVIEQGSQGSAIFDVQQLKADTAYIYRIKTQFVLPPTGPTSGPNIVSTTYSNSVGFRTKKADGTGGATIGVEDTATPFTIKTNKSTLATREATISADIISTNTYTSTPLQTWFRFREKSKLGWNISAFSGQLKTIGSGSFQHLFKGVAASTDSCASLGASINLNKIPENRAVLGNIEEVTIDGKIYQYQAAAQYESILRKTNAYLCDPTSGSGVVQGTSTASDTGDNTYTFITPLPLGENFLEENKTSIEIGEGDILDLMNRIFILMLITAIVLAVVFMIIGGARYATGDSLGAIGGGKEIITNAVKGLLFALLAWLLLNLVNPDLLRFSLELENKGSLVAGGVSPENGSEGNSGGTGSANTEELAQFIIDAFDSGLWAEYEVKDSTLATRLNTEIKSILETKGKVGACARRAGKCVLHVPQATAAHFSVYDKDNYRKTTGDVCTVSNYQTTCAPVQNITASCCKISAFTGTGSGGELGTYKTCAGQTATNNQCYLQKETNQKVVALKAKQSSLRITEAWPPSFAGHSDTPCHQFGTCIDANISGSSGGGNTGGSGGVGQGDKVIKDNLTYIFQEFNMSGGVRNATEYGIVTIKNKLTGAAKWGSQIKTAAREVGIEARLLGTIVAIESDGVPGQTSGANPPAYGLVQMQAATAVTAARQLSRTISEAEARRILLSSNDTDILFSLKMAAQYIKSNKQSSIQNQLAGYNGGYGSNTMGNSTNCPNRKRWECPWESGTTASDLCYDASNPKKPLRTNCTLNADRPSGSFEEARFYVVNGVRMYNQANQFE